MMLRCTRLAASLSVVFSLVGLGSAAEQPTRAVLNPAGGTIRTITEAGPVIDAAPAPGELPPGRTSAPGLAACGSLAGPLAWTRSSQANGVTVDPCGRVERDADARAPARAASTLAGLTIDRMTTKGASYTVTYHPGGTILLLGGADTYTLSDGSSWGSGAGFGYLYSTSLDRVEVSGDTIRYVLFAPPDSGKIYQQADYDSGDHSSQGTLAAGPLVIEATAGSATAIMRGNALIVDNTMTGYGEPRFNYFSAIVGSVVPFQQTYTLVDGTTWQPDTFTRPFDYTNTGRVDFERPVSVPRAVALTILGPPEVPEEAVVQLTAAVRYENEVVRAVTDSAAWRVRPIAIATIVSPPRQWRG